MGIFSRDDQSPAGSSEAKASAPAAPQPSVSGDRSLIARPMILEGTVSGSGDIHIDGTVKGAITCESAVRVAKRGRIEATIHARTVEVAGTVEGDITADERILLEPSATVNGDITAPRILIQDGATFRGQVNMRGGSTPSPAADSTDNTKKPATK